MNRALLSSRLSVGALVVLAATAAMATMQPALPWSARSVQLWTGGAALLLYACVVLYSLRKYVHKLGISPEFGMRVPVTAVERAELRLKRLQVEAAADRTASAAALLQRAERVLREEGVHRIVRPEVEATAPGQPSIRLVRTMPLGRTAFWLHVHVYLGLCAVAVALLHGGFGLDGPVALVLNGLGYLVTLSGLVGVACWVWGPAWLTRREHREGLSLERAHALVDSLRHKLDRAMGDLERDERRLALAARRSPQAARFRELEAAATTPLARDVAVLLQQHAEVRLRHGRLRRVRFWMNCWRLVHLPAAILLLAGACVHVLSIAIY